MKTPLYTILFALIALSTSFATMTPQERKLVSGLSSQNDELRGIVTDQDKQIVKLSTDGLFANQKIESLTSRLAQSKVDSEAQLQDLLLQDGKIKALEQDRDFQFNRAEKNFNERNLAILERDQRRKERDIGLVLFAGMATGLVMVFSGQIIGWITRQFPVLTPYGIALWIGLAVLSFLSAYGSGLGVLKLIASRL